MAARQLRLPSVYGQLWNIETFMSGLKRLTGWQFATRRPNTLDTETTIRVVVYSLVNSYPGVGDVFCTARPDKERVVSFVRAPVVAGPKEPQARVAAAISAVFRNEDFTHSAQEKWKYKKCSAT